MQRQAMYTATTFRTRKKSWKAKNPSNQEALDRLQTAMDNTRLENFKRSISRAIKSLAKSKEVIATYEDALALHDVGHCFAQIICPRSSEPVQMPAKSKRRTKNTEDASKKADSKKQRLLDEVFDVVPASSNTSSCDGASTSAAIRDVVEPNACSAKESRFQDAKKEACQKWTHPIQNVNLVWKVVLLVDIREQQSKHILAKCSMSGIPAEERVLPIGDMAWVAQGMPATRSNDSSPSAELMIGTIIERKTTADLVSSLFGSRYMEQRLRLQQCGLPQVLFLIEGDVQKDVHPDFPADRLQMALMETRVYLDFQIVYTGHMDETVCTLKRFHRRILQRTFPEAFGRTSTTALPTFASPDANSRAGRRPQQGHNSRRRQRRPVSLLEMVMDTPPVPAFGESRFMTYNELKCRVERDREAGTRTVGALHGAMLRQFCGQQTIKAVRQTYPTVASLMQAYDLADNPKEKAELLMDLPLVNSDRKVGAKTSSEIYFAYCSNPHSLPDDSNTRLPKETNVEATAVSKGDNESTHARNSSSGKALADGSSEKQACSHRYQPKSVRTTCDPSICQRESRKAPQTVSCIDLISSDDEADTLNSRSKATLAGATIDGQSKLKSPPSTNTKVKSLSNKDATLHTLPEEESLGSTSYHESDFGIDANMKKQESQAIGKTHEAKKAQLQDDSSMDKENDSGIMMRKCNRQTKALPKRSMERRHSTNSSISSDEDSLEYLFPSKTKPKRGNKAQVGEKKRVATPVEVIEID